ncbi:MAG: 30S ribosomal protein S4 [bacterium]|nr:30S ribosomal protein S4 [bacterium]
MARYTGPKEKIERRLGVKLFLKGERSYSPKSAMTKRPYPPGAHGNKLAGKRRLSEYGQQLQSKQKVKNMYRMLERQFKNLVQESMKSKDESTNLIVEKLESRLDNVVFRCGFAQSRDQARQIVNHGHIVVNKKKVDIASSNVKKDSMISIREASKKLPYFSNLMPQWFAQHEPPSWVSVDKASFTAKINGRPAINESGVEAKDLRSIIEFYSR